MVNIEHRLRRIETVSGANGTCRAYGHTEAEIDRYGAMLRQKGFSGEIERVLIRRIFVSPPPRDHAGNIIGPAPPPMYADGNKIEANPHA